MEFLPIEIFGPRKSNLLSTNKVLICLRGKSGKMSQFSQRFRFSPTAFAFTTAANRFLIENELQLTVVVFDQSQWNLNAILGDCHRSCVRVGTIYD